MELINNIAKAHAGVRDLLSGIDKGELSTGIPVDLLPGPSVGLAHFSIGYVLTYGPFVIAASLTISRGS